ncbi:MAG TPA: alpha-amylase family glycosyl hydrolase [Caulobacteraceae bacterium]|nr:alpha-amylase family glycosyl hydrolase [Caulobacteraceae bacterium]
MSEPWWRGAVVYHVYVRSFFDSNGDGQGDLPGVAAKLDYIKSLGVDAVWLSPIHPSPNRDWGYDVADYHAIQHDYGTLEDFERLLEAAHARGLKVILDEVLAHTSDEHAWFKDSMRRGEKADWYVWADPREDGTAPNNWLSAFGGPAWAYQPARRQHYHHKFLRQQPKLNWRNPAAREAALGVLDFWLAKGVDGFRLDVANAYLHDDALTDNPAVPVAQRTKWHWSHAANLQEHWRDSNLVENTETLDAVRRVVERYDDRFVFGEFSEEAGRCGGFAASDEGLHAGYSFPLLIASRLGSDFILKHFEELSQHPDHWPCISFSNHDVPRTLTRFGGRDAPPALARMMLALLLSLRGTTLLYQGEELGLPEADLTREQLRDPVGDLYWPVHKGRDGCRTPMPWSREPNHGFTSGEPWLPAAPEHLGLTVEEQDADEGSTLALARRLIALRRQTPALRLGDIRFRQQAGPVLAFERGDVLCAFNMGAEATELPSAGETLIEQQGAYGFRISR